MKSHAIQTALQALLEEATTGCPASHVKRYCLYLKSDGGYRLEEHPNPWDLVRAKQLAYTHGGHGRAA